MRKSMKKTLAAILAAAVVMSAGTTSVFASHGKGCCGKNYAVCDNRGKNCDRYVDKNKDGKCDNCAVKRGKYVDKNKDGKCDVCGNTRKNCHFADANNDGVCDNKGTGSCGKGNAGKGCGQGRGNGCRRNG